MQYRTAPGDEPIKKLNTASLNEAKSTSSGYIMTLKKECQDLDRDVPDSSTNSGNLKSELESTLKSLDKSISLISNMEKDDDKW